jgi:activator of HSP90 ATPase
VSQPIHQEQAFEGSPESVFAALTDGPTFSAMTGAPAQIDARPGGEFSCFGGAISGRNIELLPGKRVVQAWRVGPWPEGVYSIVRFEIEPAGEGAKVTLDHDGFPAGTGEHLGAGWETNYWAALRKHLA